MRGWSNLCVRRRLPERHVLEYQCMRYAYTNACADSCTDRRPNGYTYRCTHSSTERGTYNSSNACTDRYPYC